MNAHTPETTPDTIRNAIDAALAPLREQLAVVDAEMERVQVELVKLRAMRAEVMKVLRAADPTTVAPGRAPGGGKPKRTGRGIGEERIEAIFEWLQENADGEAFHASGLARRDDFSIARGQQSTISKALVELADRGLLRLDHTGTGGSRFYKLVDVR